MERVPGRVACNDQDVADAAPREPRHARMRIALAVAAACLLSLGAGSPASGASRSVYRVQRLCGSPRPGSASCTGMKLIDASLTPAALHARALRQRREARAGARPAISSASPPTGYLTPQSLHAAYQLPSETSVAATQTIAVVDAFDDPTAEADLGVYDTQFGLPACTSANGCFRKLNEQGKSSPLPAVEGEWAGETSIDVQMAHAICPGCHVLLVEANSEEFSDLGTAVNAAVTAGATEVSNSYAGPEEAAYEAYNTSFYNHPGVVITAASGDCGYLNDACGWAQAANFPADSPDVVAVGGTKLTATKAAWKSTVWNDGGSGCSVLFGAPLWQSATPNFSATGCGAGRAVADVAAIGDPNTGVDVYDSTPEGNGDPTGWGVWGGTSVASPIVAAEFALAGGAHGVSYPAATLYSHSGEAGALYDVVSGANGACAGASICQALAGYDGPTGIGSPIGVRAFASAGSPTSTAPATISGFAEQGQTLTVAQGKWTNSPTSIAEQWELCNASGASCSAFAAATGQTLTLTGGEVGATIRVQETATNADGASAPSLSAQTAGVVSNKPTIARLSPATGITGSWTTIEGSGLGATSEVQFGTLSASFRVLSVTKLEAQVPSGARAGKIELTSPIGNTKSSGKFTPTLSITSFSPEGGPAGTEVKIKGIGFTPGSSVSFGGVPAAGVSYLSATKLTAMAPAGATRAAITVTNALAPIGAVSSASSYAPG